MIGQQQYVLTLYNDDAGLHYELSINNGYTIASADPDCIVSALMGAFPMTEEEAAVA